MIRPVIILAIVDLPDPDSPTNPRVSPSYTSKLTSFKAFTASLLSIFFNKDPSSKVLETFSKSKIFLLLVSLTPHVLIIFFVRLAEFNVISFPSGLIKVNRLIFLFVGGTEIIKLLPSNDWGFVKIFLVKPCSTIIPNRIIATLLVISAITPIS